MHLRYDTLYLFFDYDFQQSRKSLEENNQSVQCLLDYFNDETENGKLYINYPMSESLFYTRQLPNTDSVSVSILNSFPLFLYEYLKTY